MAHKGKGWHGDSEGHAKAGRKGGEARARNRRAGFKKGQKPDIDWEVDMDDYDY